ncbi:MAG: CAP domain-containing protein [Patescibacteria group bacterium]|nr:CAP domain-containing protein [Patescibacteria group bacterium]
MQIWEGFKRHFIPSHENAYQPKILHRSWLLFFLALVLASEGFLVADLIARQGDQNFLAAVVSAEVVALTNDERAQNNVGHLATSALLTQAAQAKADDMAQKGYFSHTGPDGKTPWQWISAAGYRYQYAGENLAVRFVNSSDVVNAWMASPAHRDNMVKPVYTQIGVGVAQGLFQGQMAAYVVQFFGAPAAGANINNSAAAVAASAPSAPLAQSLQRQILRALADPEVVSSGVLGGTATLLIIALLLTFFMHVQIQPAHTLMQAAIVVAFALSFLLLNERLVSANRSGLMPQDQAASVGYSLFP